MSQEISTANTLIMRSSVSVVYDAQAARIATGNRIVTAVKRANGLLDNNTDMNAAPPEIDEEDARKFIDILLEEYYLINKEYTGSQFMNEGAFRKILARLGDKIQYTNSLFIYHMMSVYVRQKDTEDILVKTISQMVKDHPIWDDFLKDVKGCGPLMAAVCIAYLDPYKARHVSSFWRYAGLDVVYEPYAKNPKLKSVAAYDPNDPVGSAERGAFPEDEEQETETPRLYFRKGVRIEWDDDREPYADNVFDAVAEDDYIVITNLNGTFKLPMKEKDTVIKPNKRNGLMEPQIVPGAKIIDFNIFDLPVPIPAPEGEMVGRSRRHLVDVDYVSKTGEVKTKKSISYNPVLKTKLMGVMADCFLKCPGSTYEQVYRNYRHRLDCSPRHLGKSDAHKHMMAKRYAIKMFLQDLWVAWRKLEGLEISDPYPVAKLGMKPHGYMYDKPVEQAEEN